MFPNHASVIELNDHGPAVTAFLCDAARASLSSQWVVDEQTGKASEKVCWNRDRNPRTFLVGRIKKDTSGQGLAFRWVMKPAANYERSSGRNAAL
jgi:hypothetical protein